jgi:galactokinase/mevalonate kinase-like predicted kinase
MDEYMKQAIDAHIGGLLLVCNILKDHLENNEAIPDHAYEVVSQLINIEDMAQETFTKDSGRNFHYWRKFANGYATKEDMRMALESSSEFANSIYNDIVFMVTQAKLENVTMEQIENYEKKVG